MERRRGEERRGEGREGWERGENLREWKRRERKGRSKGKGVGAQEEAGEGQKAIKKSTKPYT